MLDAPTLLVPLTAGLLGFVNGVRHAFEPDHVATVATLVAGERRWQASFHYATAWGLGHGATLIVVAGLLSIVGATLPARAGAALELLVGVTLIGMGVRGLALVTRGPSPAARTARTFAGRRLPFAVGLVHGLAGSGALAALVSARLASPVLAMSVIALYATGAAAGMSALAGLLGLPIGKLACSRRGAAILIATSSAFAMIFGVVLVIQIAIGT